MLRDAIARLDRAGQAEAAMEWSAMEMGIALGLKLNRLGHLNGSYELRSDSVGPSLSGTFEADQSHLRHWLSELERVLG